MYRSYDWVFEGCRLPTRAVRIAKHGMGLF